MTGLCWLWRLLNIQEFHKPQLLIAWDRRGGSSSIVEIGKPYKSGLLTIPLHMPQSWFISSPQHEATEAQRFKTFAQITEPGSGDARLWAQVYQVPQHMLSHTVLCLHTQHYGKWAEQAITMKEYPADLEPHALCIFQYFFSISQYFFCDTLYSEDTLFFDHSGRPYGEQLTGAGRPSGSPMALPLSVGGSGGR